MHTEPFEPSHVVGAVAHPSQARFQIALEKPSAWRGLWPDTISVFDGDELIAIGGIASFVDILDAWILFTDNITPARFLLVHRVVVRVLLHFEQMHDPIIAHIDARNPNAARWAALLALETRRIETLPDGSRTLRLESHVH